MSDRRAKVVEIAATIVIAVAVLFGGRGLLLALARFPTVSLGLVAAIVVVQLLALRRSAGDRSERGRLLVTRDITYLAGSLLALIAVAVPQRWSIGACIVAAEFALVLDLFARFSEPTEPAA
jgi:hypothetical protein